MAKRCAFLFLLFLRKQRTGPVRRPVPNSRQHHRQQSAQKRGRKKGHLLSLIFFSAARRAGDLARGEGVARGAVCFYCRTSCQLLARPPVPTRPWASPRRRRRRPMVFPSFTTESRGCGGAHVMGGRCCCVAVFMAVLFAELRAHPRCSMMFNTYSNTHKKLE